MFTPAKVRLATKDDLPRLIELLAQLLLAPPKQTDSVPVDAYARAFAEIADDPRQHLFVVEAESRVVGTACLIIMPNLTHRGKPYGVVENVVVDAESRSRGYGKALMGHVMQQARSEGCYKLSLASNKQRSDAHRFYKRLGFRSTQKAFRVDFD